ncbi:MAG: hypothetical protein AAFW01_06695, partial [Pseudomonadota bacterium]
MSAAPAGRDRGFAAAAAGRDYIGSRDHQEDRFAARTLETPDGMQLIAVLCDGMGGHAAGEVASQTALDRAVASLVANAAAPPRERLIEALS